MTKGKILVVDDNRLNLELAVDLLKANGYTVLEAEEAISGIDLAKKELPDLILMDIQLPGMDGLTATRVIGEDPTVNGIPVVALTAHAMHGDEEKMREAGCVGYISKPIETRTFVRVIEQYLNGRRF